MCSAVLILEMWDRPRDSLNDKHLDSFSIENPQNQKIKVYPYPGYVKTTAHLVFTFKWVE